MDLVWDMFELEALEPLAAAGKLGAVLFQFPKWFVIGRKNKDYILECAERLKDFRLAIEFRHKSWMERAQRRGDALVPPRSTTCRSSVWTCRRGSTRRCRRSVAAATAKDLALVRFHGRDPEVWGKKDVSASERFRYEYSENELREVAGRGLDFSEQARETHVLTIFCIGTTR